jgi:ABC-type uncharacterized transport system permease subunit
VKNFAYGFVACAALVFARDEQWGGVIMSVVLAVINGLLWAGHHEE